MKDLFKVNLQLFAEDDNQDGVVDHQEEDINDIDYDDSDIDSFDDDVDNSDEEEIEGDDVDSDLSEEEEEVADPQDDDKQSPEENARMKKIRLKAEEQARKKIEAELAEERKQIEAMKLSMEQQNAEKRILDEHVSPQSVYDYAYKNDVSEEQARKILEADAKKLIDAEKTKVVERFNNLQNTKRELQKDKYFKLLEKDVDSMVEQNPNLDYKAVYYYQRGLKSDELETQLAKNVEKRTIANMHDRARRKNLGNSSGGSSDAVNAAEVLSSQGMEMANAFGNDPREIAKYVKQKTKRKRG